MIAVNTFLVGVVNDTFTQQHHTGCVDLRDAWQKCVQIGGSAVPVALMLEHSRAET